MANPATQDDGLIILSDDTTSAVIQAPQPTTTPVSQDTIIDFWLWDSVTSPATPSPVTISVPTPPTPASSVDFSFDLWLDTPAVMASNNSTPSVSVQPEVSLSPAPEVKKEEVVVSFQTPTIESPSKVITDDTDMDSILDGTIGKLKARQEVIGQTKGKKTSRIDELSKQIEELQQQVADLKDDVVDLDDENARINTNITSLESMKMFEKAQEEEKIRAHDLKKVAKK